MQTIQFYILLFTLGGIGTLFRYTLFNILQIGLHSTIWSTIVINILGCFCAGIFYALLDITSVQLRILLITGFLGAFTTFSAIIIETSIVFRTQHWAFSVGYILIQNIFGMVAFLLGRSIIR